MRFKLKTVPFKQQHFIFPIHSYVLTDFNIKLFLVAAKIRNLHDYHLRLLHGVMPLPSGIDIANTIKYFSQTLLSK
jgi:hypothetical protein